MGITVQKTSEWLAANYPAIHSWFPCKEERAAVSSSKTLVDYSRGIDIVGSRDLDYTLNDAIQITGTAAQGNDFKDAGGLGTELVVAADEHLILMCTVKNADISTSYVYIGQANENDTINPVYAGAAPKFTSGGVDIVEDTASGQTGTITMVMGLDRTANVANFSHVVNGGASVSALRSVALSGTAYDGAAIDFNTTPAASGLSIYGADGGANPVGLYQLVIAKFRGDYPIWSSGGGGSSVFVTDTLAWHNYGISGAKGLPPFLKELTV